VETNHPCTVKGMSLVRYPFPERVSEREGPSTLCGWLRNIYAWTIPEKALSHPGGTYIIHPTDQ